MDSINQALSQAVQLHQSGKIEESEKIYRQILQQDPQQPDALHFLGVIAMQVGKPEDAIACIRQAIKINPNNADYYINLGTAYSTLERHEETSKCYEKALEINPHFAEVHYNLGKTQEDQGKIEDAITSYTQALEIKPNSVRFHVNRSLAKLKLGDYAGGWVEYEWRWQDPRARKRSFTQLPWDGSDLTGRTILIHAEQSLSDTLQFVRYLPLVKELGGKVIFECQPPLKKLLESIAGCDELYAFGESLPPFDVHLPLLSLPKIFCTTLDTVPQQTAYLEVDPQQAELWKQQLCEQINDESEDLKVGISWQEDPRHPQAQKRSIALSQFAPLSKIDGAKLINLQIGFGQENLTKTISEADSVELIDLKIEEDQNTDLMLSVTSLISQLDLVITADTITAHLAGALGVEVWLLLPCVSDWRWLSDRNDSPWYPKMMLFRQKESGKWELLFSEVEAMLRRRVAQQQD